MACCQRDDLVGMGKQKTVAGYSAIFRQSGQSALVCASAYCNGSTTTRQSVAGKGLRKNVVFSMTVCFPEPPWKCANLPIRFPRSTQNNSRPSTQPKRAWQEGMGCPTTMNGVFMRVPVLLASASALIGVSYTCNSQTPADDVAAQIRSQGYRCDQPVAAKRDVRCSKPDSAVWVLNCRNATFRVRLDPNRLPGLLSSKRSRSRVPHDHHGGVI
jgi:hypothetical protein